jgi:thiamine-phosphate diphosphorylase/hydroxyethylthiazole kinase
VTIVQYREKNSDTGALVETALKLKELCARYGVPLIINDRVDVAAAVDCDGVHLGQDDMNIPAARRLLGQGKIIGATVSSIQEARRAVDEGADYLGIGTVYTTATKDSKNIIGVSGVRDILTDLESRGSSIPTVIIGGITEANIQRLRFQLHMPKRSGGSSKTIDGVAVVSAIMAKDDPAFAATKFKKLWEGPPPFVPVASPTHKEVGDNKHVWNQAVARVAAGTPLSHNMTNTVVQNFAANVALAIGASPIMSNNGDEAPALAAHRGGLLINMGTATPEIIRNQIQAIQAYNAVGAPIVLDPVAAGANAIRAAQLQRVMGNGYFHVIKGNEQEIFAVAKASGYAIANAGQQRGVDSGESGLSQEQKAHMVATIAQRERNVIVMTGAADFVSDGRCTYMIENGHEYLKEVTGSGCVLGTIISAYLAANDEEERVEVVVAAILHLEIAAENAAARDDVRGPGTFVPALIDELYKIRKLSSDGTGWLKGARVVRLDAENAPVGFMQLRVLAEADH